MALIYKLVFKRKRDAQGRVCRYRIRLVVQGHLQKFGVDYDEAFAPFVDFEVVMLIVSYFVRIDAHIQHPDIVNAFLNGDIDGEVFVIWRDRVYRLVKSLYGLKQSPRLWYLKLCSVLEEFGFQKIASAECVFVQGDGPNLVVLIVSSTTFSS